MPRTKKAADFAVTVTIQPESLGALAADCNDRGDGFAAGVCTVLAHLAAGALSSQQLGFMDAVSRAGFKPYFFADSIRVEAPRAKKARSAVAG